MADEVGRRELRGSRCDDEVEVLPAREHEDRLGRGVAAGGDLEELAEGVVADSVEVDRCRGSRATDSVRERADGQYGEVLHLESASRDRDLLRELVVGAGRGHCKVVRRDRVLVERASRAHVARLPNRCGTTEVGSGEHGPTRLCPVRRGAGLTSRQLDGLRLQAALLREVKPSVELVRDDRNESLRGRRRASGDRDVQQVGAFDHLGIDGIDGFEPVDPAGA